jgi:hypothetical protein
MQMNECMNGNTHGPVHIMIGGAWDDLSEFTDLTKPLASNLKLLLFKMMWRSGFTRCPSSCDTSKPEDCKCSVPDEYVEEYGHKYLLEASGVWNAIESFFQGIIYTHTYHLLH